MWADPDYRTSGNTLWNIPFEWYIPDMRSHAYPGTGKSGDDSASSVSNTGNLETAFFFKDLRCTGYSFLIAKGTGDGNLSDSAGLAPGGFDDSITSARFASFISACGGGS